MPQGVGAVRVVRTFRIDHAGRLFPIYRDTAWTGGVNTATCARSGEHRPPEPGCGCGFYGYSHPDWAREQASSRDNLAVVRTWGTLEVGTRGLRSSHADIEALWLAETVSDDLAAQIADHYPNVAIYRDRAVMLGQHPLTDLPEFRRPYVAGSRRTALSRLMWTLAGLGVVAGAAPATVTTTTPILAAIWLAILVGAVLAVVAGLLSRSSSVVAAGSSLGAWTLSSAAPLPALIGGRLLLLGVVALFVATWRDSRIIGAPIPRQRGPEAVLRRLSRQLRSRR